MSDEIVKFLLPDGSEISNDPRWVQEKAAEAAEEALASRPNIGHAGIPDDEMAAQIGNGVSAPQSTQEGVGENATLENPDQLAGASDGRLFQNEDAKTARSEGNTPSSPAIEAPESEDSNERVLATREAADKRAEAEKEAMDALAAKGEEPGDTEKPYSEWKGAQLTAEVRVRNAGREESDQIDTAGVRKKSQLVALLEADDQKNS